MNRPRALIYFQILFLLAAHPFAGRADAFAMPILAQISPQPAPQNLEANDPFMEPNGLRKDRFEQRKILIGFMAMLLALAFWHLFLRKRAGQ